MTTRARCKHRMQLIQHMQTLSDGRLGVIPSKRALLERFGYVEGSSCTCKLVGSTSTVVVHGHSRISFVDVQGHGEKLDVHGVFEGRG